MDIVTALSQYCELREEIKDLNQRIEADQRRLEKIEQEGMVSDSVKGTRADGTIGSIRITGFPVPEYNKVKSMIKKRLAKLQIMEDELQEALNAADDFINKIPKSDLRMIFQLYYIDDMTWEFVAMNMNYRFPKKKNLTIENKCFHSQTSRDIGLPCSLEAVEEWANIDPGPVTYPGMNRMDFGYYRNPIKNRIDGSACGVSVYESAVDLIRKADIQGARLDWEYESGERAIHVDNKALKQDKSTGRFSMEKLKKRLYRGLNLEAGKDQELLKEYSPEMRDEAFKRGLEEYKREIEFSVGLAYGDLSDVQEVAKTATEIKTSKNRKYNRVTAIQNNLYDCLEDFAAGLAFYNSMLNSGYEFSCKFNDSILTDEETERQQDRADVSMGAMQLWEYRKKWYGETEEQAKVAVQNPAEVIE